MRLHSFMFSPNGLKVRLALAELGLSYERVEVDLFKGEHRTEVFARLNPFQRVPVLEDGDFVLRESNAIVAYLGQRHPGPRWPKDVRGQASALQWLFFEAAHLTHGAGILWWSEVVAPRIQKPGSDAVVVADGARSLERALELLENHLDGSGWLLGDELTLPDCVVGVALAMIRGTRMDRPEEFPKVSQYRERLRKRPSWKEAGGEALHEIA